MRAIAAGLKDSDLTREEIAQKVSAPQLSRNLRSRFHERVDGGSPRRDRDSPYDFEHFLVEQGGQRT